MDKLISEEAFAEALKLKKLKLKAFTSPLMELLKLNKVNELYSSSSNLYGADFALDILQKLNIKFTVSESDLKNIPEQGSFIAVANHPYGGIDGLILLYLLAQKRPDIKIMANYLLSKLQPLSNFIINVNPFENVGSKQINIKAAKQVLKHLQKAPVAIFPAGEVSALQLNNFKIADKKWENGVGKLIKNAKVPVVPIYFSGNNSLAFNLLGLINPALRTLKLPSELFNKTTHIEVRIGKPIKYQQIEDFTSSAVIEYLRTKTYSLAESVTKKKSLLKSIKPLIKPKEIIQRVSVELLSAEIKYLTENNLQLCKHNEFEVYIANASTIPNILREISRLREITYRAVGEGTNRSADTDAFDLYYKHLFVWDSKNNCIAGAYRLGEGDLLYKQFGVKGFYLNQLFKFKKRFHAVLYNSLELGRSFIPEAYQKKPYSLMLLWKGIGIYLNQNSNRFSYLTGPVSISGIYGKTAKYAIVNFLKEYSFDNDLGKFVLGRNAFKQKGSKHVKDLLNYNKVTDIKALDDLVSDLEKSQLKVPVLIKKYLSLNGRFVAFNVDKSFNNAIDALILVKISNIPKDAFELVSR
jgi:putative hemolysin